jgi:hypothetical protein
LREGYELSPYINSAESNPDFSGKGHSHRQQQGTENR